MSTPQQTATNADTPAALVVGPGEGERFVRHNRVVTIKIELPELSIHEIEFDTTFEVPPHTHEHLDATLVLEGEIELLGEATPRRVGPGTVVAAAPGVRHGFRNPGPKRARILALHAPDGGFADIVRNTRP
jgi:quercetin dioxygenase-like cupin family protein